VTASQQDGAGRDGTTLAEEIRLLVDLVVERAAPWLDGIVAAGHGPERATGDQPRHPDGNPAGCGWCPLCALVAIARGERPEIAARILDQAAQLIALLRAVLADRWEPQEGVHMPGYQPPPRAEPDVGRPTSPRVQHIPVRRRWTENPKDGER